MDRPSFPRLPLIILAGHDPRPGAVPPGLRQEDMLTGNKGIRMLRSGRCLAEEFVERARASNCFRDLILVGPQKIFEGHVGCEVVNVEGSLVRTLQRVVETVRRRFEPHTPVAFSSCDILPAPDEFRDLLQTCYIPHGDSMFWGQFVEARPGEMGASAWKPSYTMSVTTGESPKNLYPGHLVIARPAALRLALKKHLLQLAYRYRNRVLHKRYLGLTIRALGSLIAQDARNLLSLQLPILTLTLPLRGLWAYFMYRKRRLTLSQFEFSLSKAFLHRQYHHCAGRRPVVFSVTPIRSFAKDIDTVAEFEEANGSTSSHLSPI